MIMRKARYPPRRDVRKNTLVQYAVVPCLHQSNCSLAPIAKIAFGNFYYFGQMDESHSFEI
jgi:hypothetical protein